jgi:hypothetical protein
MSKAEVAERLAARIAKHFGDAPVAAAKKATRKAAKKKAPRAAPRKTRR